LATIDSVPRRPHVATMLRLPPELHARLVALAEKEHRSITAEVTHLLEDAVARAEREVRERERAAALQAGEPERQDDRPSG
jgi:hypothetical protein